VSTAVKPRVKFPKECFEDWVCDGRGSRSGEDEENKWQRIF